MPLVMELGCKPFQEKNLEIEILCSSDSVFSPYSEYGFNKSYDALGPSICPKNWSRPTYAILKKNLKRVGKHCSMAQINARMYLVQKTFNWTKFDHVMVH